MASLKEKTAKGLLWGAVSNGVQQVLGLAIGIILGRLLTPGDYGMMAMIGIFTTIAVTIQNSGFTSAIINKKDAGHRDYNSVFWFNVIAAAALYAILFAAAPLIADFYHEERLVPLCRYTFVGVLIVSLSTAQGAYLAKHIMVREAAKSGMTGMVVSAAVGVAMAAAGFGYWAIATQNNVFVAVNAAMLWHYSPWRPSLNINFGPVKGMMRFSMKVLATTIISHVNNNVLNILLGRFFSPPSVGSYNQAYQWSSKGFYLVQGMVQQVAQPVLAELNGQGGRQLGALRKMVRFTAFLSFPLMLGLGLVARELIVVAITEKWLPSAELLQVLCVSGTVIPLHTVFSNMVLSKGRSDINLWCTVCLGLVEIAMMLCIWPYGIRTMVVAYAAVNIAWVFVWFFFVSRLTGYGIVAFLSDVLPFAAGAAAVMAATGWATASISILPLQLVARVGMAAVLYYAVMRAANAHILRECEAFVRSMAASKLRRRHR